MRPTVHLGAFGFSGDEVFREIRTLSGGERARMALALMTLTGANLLVLDEPTNHLDVENIEVLEDALDEFDGTGDVVAPVLRRLLHALADALVGGEVDHLRHVVRTAQIHDELVLETPEAEVATVEPLVVAEMKGAMTLTVPLEVSVSHGATWAECD